MNDKQKIAELYDVSVQDWPGEIQFYRDYVSGIEENDKNVLEIACGTGRVTLQLATPEISIVGFDISLEELDIARKKSDGVLNLEFVYADMRSFQLNRRFPLIIIPGHSFQALVTIEDQLLSLKMIARHLSHYGKLVIHVNHDTLTWLAEKSHDGKDPNPEIRRIIHPRTKNVVSRSLQWQFKPAEQTAFAVSYWKEIDKTGAVVDEWSSGPNAFHVFFPFEMNHLLRRAGYKVNQVYGDFHKNPLTDNSPEMIWVVQLDHL